MDLDRAKLILQNQLSGEHTYYEHKLVKLEDVTIALDNKSTTVEAKAREVVIDDNKS